MDLELSNFDARKSITRSILGMVCKQQHFEAKIKLALPTKVSVCILSSKASTHQSDKVSKGQSARVKNVKALMLLCLDS